MKRITATWSTSHERHLGCMAWAWGSGIVPESGGSHWASPPQGQRQAGPVTPEASALHVVNVLIHGTAPE